MTKIIMYPENGHDAHLMGLLAKRHVIEKETTTWSAWEIDNKIYIIHKNKNSHTIRRAG